MSNHESETSLDASRFIFSLAVFVSSFLLFQLELIIGKRLLPWFGGVFEVWDTCMFFFQAVLLAGYFWAMRVAQSRRGPLLQLLLMTVALAACFATFYAWGSPLLPSDAWRPSPASAITPGVLNLLFISVALPFFVLSTTGPLLQAWYARIHGEENPYWLFSISNLGSLLGLLTYPLLFERYLRLRHQSYVWFGGFCFLLLCVLACLLRVRTQAPESPALAHLPAVSRRKLFLWFSFAVCGSALMLSCTNLLTQDLAPIPLLWVLPLSVYLFSFVVAFAPLRVYWRWMFHPLAAIALCVAAIALLRGSDLGIRQQIIAFNVVLFVVCTVCHGELALRKPAAGRLTTFYLTIGAGGAFGSVLVALVAPLVLHSYSEFQMSLVAFVVLLAVVLWRERHSWLHQSVPWLAPFLLTTLAVSLRFLSREHIFELPRASVALGPVIAFLALLTVWTYLVNGPQFLSRSGPRLTQLSALLFSVAACLAVLWTIRSDSGEVLARWRNPYGALLVREVDRNDGHFHRYELLNGRINHGSELIAPRDRLQPTTYYGTDSGAGIAIGALQRRTAGPMRLGAIGLGVGTLAAYSRRGDTYRFYEINPQVIRLAQGEGGYFHFVPEARGQVQIVRGDARLSMEREIQELEWQNFDVLVLDAFNGDAIPVHLLTLEAMAVYRQHLRGPDSVIAVHISNYGVNLEPVVAGLAQQYSMHAELIETPERGPASFKSSWVLLCEGSTLSDPLIRASGFEMMVHFPGEQAGPPPAPYWTDEKNDIFDLLK